MTAVKLCGLRTLPDARAAVDVGAEYVGFVLAPGYRRTVTPDAVREIVAALGRGATRYVGVFVDPDPEDARRLARYCGLDLVQLSGRESPEVVRTVGLPCVKTVHVAPDLDPLPEVARYAEVSELVLLDTYSPAAAGGTGRTFAWERAAEAAGRFPVMLAGGLTAANVRDALRAVHPVAVDVSSGVETGGAKDPEKMRAFVRAVEGAERRAPGLRGPGVRL